MVDGDAWNDHCEPNHVFHYLQATKQTTCKSLSFKVFFVIQVFYNYNVVVNSKHKLHDIDVQFVHFDFEGKVFIPCFLSFVFYIVAWKLLELLESSFAILLCSLLMHETFGIGCVVHCCILCLWSILIHLTIQFWPWNDHVD